MSVVPEFEAYAAEIAVTEGFSAPVFCGKGAFKETYRVCRGSNPDIALKLIDLRKCSDVRVMREIDALRKCNSIRISKLLDTKTVKCSDGTDFAIVVEEYFAGGTLEDRIAAGIDNATKIGICRGLALAIEELQPLRLVHRDIKPANVMFRSASSADPVLVDFGLVRDLSQASETPSWLMQGPGTPLYAAPEQLTNDKAMIDWRSDQFAVGVIVCLMLTGRHPYHEAGMSPADVIAAVANRRGPSAWIQSQLASSGLPSVTRALSPWPVGRFSNPKDFTQALSL